MRLLRNPEAMRTFLLLMALSCAATAAAFAWDRPFGLFTLALCAAFVLVWLLSTRRRYRRIAELSDSVNRILHGGGRIALDRYAEGELGILQSEIYKMTIRLREQGQRLRDDKIFLADSIADISHQIRTPLTSINLLVSLLSEPGISEERRRELAHELHGLLSRIDWLITALLKLSRLDAGTVRFSAVQIPLDELARRAAAPLLVPIELRGQRLCIDAQGEFRGDAAWTCEALGNIVKNCMEHTPDGGKIEIRARENALYTEIVISDSGSGFAKEDLPHIFERFYKGRGSDDKGFGVGLALARTIVTAQNGAIKAENAPSGGAVFTLRFYKGTV